MPEPSTAAPNRRHTSFQSLTGRGGVGARKNRTRWVPGPRNTCVPGQRPMPAQILRIPAPPPRRRRAPWPEPAIAEPFVFKKLRCGTGIALVLRTETSMKRILLTTAMGLMALGFHASAQGPAQGASAAQAAGCNCRQCACRNQNQGAQCPMASGQAGQRRGMGRTAGRGQGRGMCGCRGANAAGAQQAPAPAK